MSEMRQQEADAVQLALQTAKYLCLGFLVKSTIQDEIAVEDAFDRIAAQVGLEPLAQ